MVSPRLSTCFGWVGPIRYFPLFGLAFQKFATFSRATFTTGRDDKHGQPVLVGLELEVERHGFEATHFFQHEVFPPQKNWVAQILGLSFEVPSRERSHIRAWAFWKIIDSRVGWDMWSFPGGYFIMNVLFTRWWFQIYFIFIYFHPYLGKISILTNIFQMGWSHQLFVFGCFLPWRWVEWTWQLVVFVFLKAKPKNLLPTFQTATTTRPIVKVRWGFVVEGIGMEGFQVPYTMQDARGGHPDRHLHLRKPSV